MNSHKTITTYKDFYRYYLEQHQRPLTKIFHSVSTLLVFGVICYVIQSGKERFLWYCPIFGYGMTWFSHLVFEKNTPTGFRYPIWSLISDVRMVFELLTGKQKLSTKKIID